MPGRDNVLVTFRDTSAELQLAEERKLTIDLFSAMRMPNDLEGLLRDLVRLIRHQTGCGAVGIRLRDGDDFPYFETSGFSDEFVLLERSLCARDKHGAIRRDADGQPILDCMCGNILRGRTDPSRPFFTPHGSFWSNCTTKLLASTSAAERQAETRNRCNGGGYESVGLFPLRVGGETFGLLQVNDFRRDRFTPQSISMLETLADNLAVGLLQRQTDIKLRESIREKEVLMREVHHRVKNNLQAVASMSRLQARKTTDPQARSALLNFQTRIVAFSAVHDLLYQSQNLARVDLAAYAKRLLDHVTSLHLSPERPVNLSVSLEPGIIVGLDDAVSVGLILCELVSNALHHAFPDERSGTVTVSLARRAHERICLVVRDNGVGLPVGLENCPNRTTFGLELIGVLTRQLRATCVVERTNGTLFQVEIPARSLAAETLS